MSRKTKSERNAEDVAYFENVIKGTYNSAMNSRWSSDQLGENRLRHQESPNYLRLPMWAKMQLHGYDNAMWERFYDWLEDRWRLDGKLYVRGPERDKAFEGRWPEVEYVGKFYPGTDIQFA